MSWCEQLTHPWWHQTSSSSSPTIGTLNRGISGWWSMVPTIWTVTATWIVTWRSASYSTISHLWLCIKHITQSHRYYSHNSHYLDNFHRLHRLECRSQWKRDERICWRLHEVYNLMFVPFTDTSLSFMLISLYLHTFQSMYFSQCACNTFTR